MSGLIWYSELAGIYLAGSLILSMVIGFGIRAGRHDEPEIELDEAWSMTSQSAASVAGRRVTDVRDMPVRAAATSAEVAKVPESAL